MKIIEKRVDELVPYENNPRNNDKSVESVANSIREFGFQQPIVIDKNNVVIAGHTRLRASKSLGLEVVPCVVADDLTEEQVKAYRLADNKVCEQSQWKKDLLGFELGGITELDMSQFGFDLTEESKEKEDGEVPFTEILFEEHNYVVLFFDNEVDWLQAESIFDLTPKKNLSTRVDGKINEGFERIGVGRVINGSKALESLRKHYEDFR